MANHFSSNVLRMNLPFPGNEKREKGIPHESLRSPRTYPNFSPRPAIAGASIGLLNKNFYLCEQTKQYFANTELKSRDCSPKDSGKVTDWGKEGEVVSKMNRGPMLGKSLENVKGESLTDDTAALTSYPGQATIIKEAKLLSNSENLFSVSCDPKMFALPSRSTTCHYCGLHGSRRCGQCKQAFYCSEDCQKKDWVTHSNVCKPINCKPEDPSKLPAEAGTPQNHQKDPTSPLRDPRIESESRKRIMLTDLQSIDLKKGAEIQGTVLGFKSPSEFFVQIYSAEVAEHLSNVSLTLKSMYNNKTAVELYNPVKGEVCVAKYSVDQSWCRVVVQDVDIACKKSQLLFIDFGNEEEASLDSVYPLHSNVGLHPPAAIQCAVADVVPVQGVWTQECNSTVGQQLLGQYCTFKVIDLQRGTECWTMDVMITSIGKSLGDLLVEKGYGCKQIDLMNDPSKTAPVLEAAFVTNREKPDAKKMTLLPDPLPKVKLISLSVGDVFPAAVTDVQSPEDFFCQRLQDARKLAELQSALSSHYSTTPSCANFSPSVGDVCCAQFTEDNQWYRASVIRSVAEDRALVGYVDYGNFEVLPVSRLRPMLPVFQELRWQAIKCSLAGVKPSKGTWTSDAVSAMKEKVANKIVTVKVVKKIENTSLVEVIDEVSKPVVNVSKYLLETGHASYTDGECQTTVLDNHTSEVVKQSCSQVGKKDWTWAELTLNKQTEVTVCLLYNPGEFYCQVYREEDLCTLNKMNKMLADHCQTVSNSIANLAKDDVCCAFFSGDAHWYRGLVKEVNQDYKKAKVQFVDYGNVETVDMDKMRTILPKFLKLPFQGIRCWLSDVKPVNKLWTSEATAKLQMCVSGIKLQALPLCITEDGVGVELIDHNQEPPQIISHVLVSQHLALKNTNKADNLPISESSIVCDKTQERVLNDKCDMPRLIEQANNIPKLTEAELESHFDSTQMRQQEIQYDKMPGMGQDIYHISPTRVQIGKGEQGTKVDVPPAGQMPEEREAISNLDVLSRKGSDKGSYMPPNKKQYNKFAIELQSASTVDKLPSEEVACKMNCDAKKDVSEKGMTFCWKSVELPINEAILVYVLKVESPSMFYVQLKDNQVDKEKLQWTMIELAEYCSNHKNQNYIPNIGDVCCARYTGNNHWYRAIVLDLLGSTVRVAYVDYGNVENLQFSRLLPIKASLLELPFQIIRCSLEGIIPHTAEWSVSVMERFKSLALDQDVTIKVVSVHDDVHSVTMEKQDHQGVINVADKLFLEGLALRRTLVNDNSSFTGEMGICCCKELQEQMNKIQAVVTALELKVDHITGKLEKTVSSRMKK
ncbi:tudor domain-containing protein 1 isoform X2 [Lissotriton helveticus]